MPRTPAVPIVDVSWTGQQTGVFRLDDSLLDGTDVLSGEFGNYAYDTITADVKAGRITRGRQGDLGSMEQGRCVLTLKDSNGKYNPDNAASPLVGYLDTHKPLRVRATHNGITYGVFYGFISKIEHHPNRSEQESLIEAVDFSEWLNAAKPTIASTGTTTVGTVIGLILDELQWTDASMRSLDTGSTIPDFSADGTKSALTLIVELLQVDLGYFFIDGSGVVTYQSRANRWAVGSADFSWGDSLVSDGHPGVDKQRIINRQTVTRTGGVAQTAAAEDGKPYYDGSPITSSYLVTDTDALSLAQFIVELRKQGTPPVRNVVLWNRTDAAIVDQLTAELSARVTFTETKGGSDVDATIEGLTHEFSGGGVIYRTSYLLAKRAISAFTLDQSALDGSDVLGY